VHDALGSHGQPESGSPPAQGEAFTDDTAELIRGVLRAELDVVLPHVVRALKQQDAVAALTQRLDAAEKRLAERQNRPLIAGVRRVLTTVRRLEFDEQAKAAILAELEGLLVGAGYTEFGDEGEAFDPRRHDAISGDVAAGGGMVAEVLEPGLETLGEVVVPARVRIANHHKRGMGQ
jgi:hypothetical protein